MFSNISFAVVSFFRVKRKVKSFKVIDAEWNINTIKYIIGSQTICPAIDKRTFWVWFALMFLIIIFINSWPVLNEVEYDFYINHVIFDMRKHSDWTLCTLHSCNQITLRPQALFIHSFIPPAVAWFHFKKRLPSITPHSPAFCLCQKALQRKESANAQLINLIITINYTITGNYE